MMASVVVVGTSLGGLSALQVLLSGLPPGFPSPVVVVQHRGKTADDALVRLLGSQSALPVSEPDDKQPLEAGHVYLAPADYHVLVEPGTLALSTEEPVNHARPSIDVLFESAADTYGRGAVGVVLTGANQDGAKGCVRIKERGGVVIVQDPAGAESGVMPAAAIAACAVDTVLPLSEPPSCSTSAGPRQGKPRGENVQEEKVNILLVDDQPEGLLTLEAILEGLEQNLVKARSGTEALRQLLTQEFAVVLLDVQMPEMDGYETAALIRERPSSRHTPIIFLTASHRADVHTLRGYAVGAVDYLFKPLDETFFGRRYRSSSSWQRSPPSSGNRPPSSSRKRWRHASSPKRGPGCSRSWSRGTVTWKPSTKSWKPSRTRSRTTSEPP